MKTRRCSDSRPAVTVNVDAGQTVYSTRVNVPESLSLPIFNAERASDLNAGDVSETAWSVRPAPPPNTSISAIISTPDAANRGSLPLNLK